jgi:FAD/FMN-containing dehydrogenase
VTAVRGGVRGRESQGLDGQIGDRYGLAQMSLPQQHSRPSADLVAAFVAIVGAANAVVDPEPEAPFLNERRGTYHGRTPVLLKPGSVEEVSAILRLANDTGTAIVPQGGNTGLVGGQIPDAGGNEILVALDRLDKVRSIDADGDAMTVEAGVTLAGARKAAADAGRLFPLAIGSMEHCRIGGNLSTNAGGTAVLAYGSSRDLVLGLEVVLAGGAVIHGLRALRKDNAGYDLKQLFIGAEGTLGIITAATLKLFPLAQGKRTAFVGVASPADALALFHIARSRASFELTSFELMPRICLDFCLRHLDGAVDPLPAPHPWYVLAEISSGESAAAAEADFEAILAEGRSAGVVQDSVIPASSDEAAAIWRMRYSIADVQRPEGVSIKHDISVPVSVVPAFIDAGIETVTMLVPDCRPVPFGHIGDGNIHFNVSQPEGGDGASFRARRGEINRAIFDLVARHGGSIAAEHGIGQMKRDLLPTVRSDVEMDVMRRIKAALDPKGILNPGKVL